MPVCNWVSKDQRKTVKGTAYLLSDSGLSSPLKSLIALIKHKTKVSSIDRLLLSFSCILWWLWGLWRWHLFRSASVLWHLIGVQMFCWGLRRKRYQIQHKALSQNPNADNLDTELFPKSPPPH